MSPTQTLTESGLQRRIKLHLHAKPQLFFAVCAVGFESILEQEIRGLKEAIIVQVVDGGVEFSGPFHLIYEANLVLRTAVRVLLRIQTFVACSYPELFNKSCRIAWERYAGLKPLLGFECSANTSRLHHTDNIIKTVYDAIKEIYGDFGINPNQSDMPDTSFYIRMSRDQCTISLDSSGELLYKRGWREAIGHAPIRESLASAILGYAECRKFSRIVDPFCGSGTFCIEAIHSLIHHAPGLNRKFAFEKWPSFQEARYHYGQKKIASQEMTASAVSVVGSDISKAAIQAAGENGQRAGVSKWVSFTQSDCVESLRKNGGRDMLVVSNLPYGKRSLDSGEIGPLYRTFGQAMKDNMKRGSRFALVVPDESVSDLLKLPVSKLIRFMNGGLPVKLIMGDL
ncbi:MAG: hypothetical protein A2293_07535 [Elusimicrobia bacterium RIFOXYB2_FULL_49_7]|nr:MAG: hypothetical protein A2293_07535 [Elusimicrobia bacterium RIFOXYB2_FULL_49_7]